MFPGVLQNPASPVDFGNQQRQHKRRQTQEDGQAERQRLEIRRKCLATDALQWEEARQVGSVAYLVPPRHGGGLQPLVAHRAGADPRRPQRG